MAENVKKVTIKIDDNGSLAAVTGDAKEANQEFKKLEGNVKSTSKALASLQNISNMGKAASMAAQKAEATSDMVDYKIAKGITGATGAAARDFAKQSQGLGGLVHVYATFAANLFAVSAAFTALRNAMDTTNMIKGLDQLGAASGRALGATAKNVVALTDGAVSLREAMTAVAQSSSAGMSTTNIERMAKGAQKVSVALGLSIPDALSRLSRGMSKIEPELLDELGIFVKVDQAARDYARTVGKTAASLSDVERRHAFTLATLDQLEKKFKDVDQASNPYSQLLASTQNILQSGLEVANKFITPIVKFFATSPTALIAGLTTIVGLLAKMAIPAIGNWKENAKESAERARAIANERNLSIRGTAQYNKLLQESDDRLASQIAKLDQIEKKGKALSEGTSSASKLFTKPAENWTEKDWDQLEKNIVRANKTNVELAQQYTDLKTNTQAYLREAKAYQELDKKPLELMAARATMWTAEGRNQLLANKANIAAIKEEITARAAQVASERGFMEALRSGWSEVSKARREAGTISTQVPLPPGIDGKPRLNADGTQKMLTITQSLPTMGKIAAAATAIDVAVTAAGVGISKMVGAMQGWLGAIGVVVSALVILDSVMSKNEKEMAAASSAIDATSSSLAALRSVYSSLDKKENNEWLSVASMNARATASAEMADAFKKSFTAIKVAIETSGTWETVTQRFFKIFGKDNISKQAKIVKDTIDLTLREDVSSSALTQLKADTLNAEKIEDPTNRLKAYTDAFTKYSAAVNAANAAQQSFSGLLQENTKLLAESINTLIPQDPLSKLSINLIKIGETLANLSKDTTKFAVNVGDMTDTEIVSLNLTEEKTRALKVQQMELKELSAAYASAMKLEKSTESDIIRLTNERESLKADKATSRRSDVSNNIQSDINRKTADIAVAISKLQESQKQSATVSAKLQAGTEEAKKLMSGIAQSGSALLTTALDITVAQAGLAAKAAANNGLIGTAANQAQYDLVKEEVALQKTSNNIMLNLAYAQHKNTLAVELATAEAEKRHQEEKARNPTLSADARFNAGESARRLESTIERLMTQRTQLGDSPKAFMKAFKEDPTGGNSSLAVQLQAGEAKNRAADMKVLAELYSKQQKDLSEKYKDRYREIDNIVNREQESLKIQQDIANLTGDTGAQESANRAAEELNRLALERLDRQREEILENTKLRISQGATAKQAYESEILALKLHNDKVEAIKRENAARTKTQAINTINNLAAREAIRLNTEYLVGQENSAKALANNSSEQSKLDMLRELGAISDARYEAEKRNIELEALGLKYAADRATIEKTRRDAEQQAKKTYDITVATDPNSQVAAESERLRAVTEAQRIANAALETSKIKYDQDRKSVDVLGRYNEQLAKQKGILDEISSVTLALGSAFGDVGTAIGGAIEALAKYAQKQEEVQKAKEALDPVSQKADILKLDQKIAKQELDGVASVAAASKKIFSEKTAAYKILNAAEKAASILRITLALEEWAVKAGLIATEISAESAKNVTVLTQRQAAAAVDVALTASTETAKNTAKAPGVIASFMSWLGPFGMAAGIAALAAIGIGFSGKGSSVPPGTTAADKQKIQGTGQSYDASGNIVSNGGGYLGDLTKVSTSIKDGIDSLGSVMFEMLDFDKSETYKVLRAIQRNTENFVKAISTTTGITGGTSAFGTIEGSKKSFLGFSSSSTTILDTGIKLVGKLNDLIRGTGSMQQYETVQTSKSSWFGLVKSNKINTTTKDLEESAAKYISSIFSSFKSVVVTSAELFSDKTRTELEAQLDDLDVTVSVSAKGLSNQEFADAVMAQIGIELDKAVQSISPNLQRYYSIYGTLSESMSDFVFRLVNSTKTVKLAFDSIGKDANISLDGVLNLIEASGDLDTFVDNTKKFADTFLTESERLLPIQNAVNKKMSELGFGAIKTKDQFKQLVLGYRVVDSQSAETYSSLLNLASAFAEVDTAGADLASSHRDLLVDILKLEGRQLAATALARAAELDSLDQTQRLAKVYIYALEDEALARDLNIKLLEAEGKSVEVLALTREKELEALSSVMRPYQKYIYTLEDEKTAKNKLTETYKRESSAIKSTITSLDSLITNLNNYKDSLMLGGLSAATPLELYQEAKSQLDQLFVAALGSATTEAEIAARNDAINKIPGAASAFLESSKTLFASSERYKVDYSNVLSILDQTSSNLTTQKSVNQQQLEAMEASAKTLKLIEDYQTSNYWDDLQAFDLAAQIAKAEKPMIDLLSVARENSEIAAQAYYSNSTESTKEANNLLASLDATMRAAAASADASRVREAYEAAGLAGSISTIGGNIVANTTDFTNAANKQIDWLGAINESNWVSANRLADINEASWSSSNWLQEVNKVSWDNHSELTTLNKTVADILARAEADAKIRADQLAAAKAAQEAAEATAAAAAAAAAAAISTAVSSSATASIIDPGYGTGDGGDGGVGVGAFALGGLASGWSLVGEKGPELVNFSDPGRVYTATQTREMLAAGGTSDNTNLRIDRLLTEIKNLNRQVEQLRQEQAKQTGAIIQSNYDANARAANEISTSVEETAKEQQWAARTQVKVA